MAAIETIPCATAEELLMGLHHTNSVWGGDRHLWVFRGHEDDSYELVPTALRDQAQLGYTSSPCIGVQKLNKEQVLAEFRRAHEFYWSADAQGLHIAGNSDILRTPTGWTQFWDRLESHGWPTDDLLPLLALAQHYGVSTRLLDWAEKPLVAAYFAGKGAARKKTARLGIWALNLDWVINYGFRSNGSPIAVYVVTAPRASNPNLHAQGGVFTAEQVVKSELGKKVLVRPVHRLIEKQWKKMGHGKAVMVHLTLPSHEAGKLLRLLHQDGISAATLFPGYQGVAESLGERVLWDHPIRGSYWVPP